MKTNRWNRAFLFAFFLFSVIPFRGWAQTDNWVVNGDFKGQGGWTGNLVLQPGLNGSPSAFLENTQPSWNDLIQKINFPQPPPPVVEIAGWLKTDSVVKGTEDWEMARITVVFYDAQGKRLGDWPAPIAQVDGTQDWEFYDNQYQPPPDTASADLSLSLDNCTGKAWFSDIQFYAYDGDGKPLAPGQPSHPGLKPPITQRSDNWLLDGDFETLGSDAWTQGHITLGGHDSLHCLEVENTTPAWTLASQDVSFRGQTPVSVIYGGWVRTENVVRGEKFYMAARLGIDFRDKDNHQVGGWQNEVCMVTGTTDWTYYEMPFAVPVGAVGAHLDAGLGDCTGKAFFDDLSLKLLDSSGHPITAILPTEQVSNTSDWYTYKPPAVYSDTPLDLSFLNDKPAGSHGFVSVKNGHFICADGTVLRFWGTDLVGPNNFPTHEQADALALRLSRLGVNLVRFHMPDASWSRQDNIFNPQADNTLSLDPSQLDKFDYLMAALEKQGIYLYPDWLVDRKFRKGDGVMDYQALDSGAKGVIHFDPRVIELTQRYAKELLDHVNPYTGKALKDDPAYLGNEIVNESSIFCGFGDQKFPESYWNELQGLYRAWGGKGTITRFKFDFETQKLVPIAHPENANASLRFLLWEVTKTDLEMKAFQHRLSPHALLAGSNMGLPVLGNIRSDARLDFMDTHAYWDHPQIWNIEGGWSKVAYAPMNNNSQLLNPFQGSLVFNLCQAAVENKPLIVTEWNDCFPNEYRLEGPVLMAAYGGLQDWDGLLQFDCGLDMPGTVRMTNFDINSRVDNEPLFQAGALIFRRDYLSPSPVTVLEPLSDKDVLANGMKSDWLPDHPWLPYVARVEKRFTGQKSEKAPNLSALEKDHPANEKVLISSTGQETLDYGKGILLLDSPRVQGLAGAIGDGVVRGTPGFKIRVASRDPWAAVLAVSLDGKPLRESRSMVLFAVARAENSGQVFNATRTALINPGFPPILMQGVLAGISLGVDPDRTFRVVPVDESGVEGMPLKVDQQKGSLRFVISPSDHTAYYRIIAD